MQNAEVAFMAFLILYFLLSLKEMSELVNAIHKSDGKKSVEDIDALKEKISRIVHLIIKRQINLRRSMKLKRNT